MGHLKHKESDFPYDWINPGFQIVGRSQVCNNERWLSQREGIHGHSMHYDGPLSLQGSCTNCLLVSSISHMISMRILPQFVAWDSKLMMIGSLPLRTYPLPATTGIWIQQLAFIVASNGNVMICANESSSNSREREGVLPCQLETYWLHVQRLHQVLPLQVVW